MSDRDMTGITVYVIGNAHIDPVWLWDWREGFAEVLATCRSALDRMRDYPDFVFTRADAATYQWIEDACPEMFEEIREFVKEGRWSIVGGWWEQPDCNIPCGESFVRHELYGKRYFLDRFGLDISVGYNVDSFGHSAGLPQILAKAGIKYYVFMRPGPHEKDLPDSVFWWEGPDGSRVMAHRLCEPYCIWSDLPAHIQRSIDDRPRGTNVAARFYGVGNHGGGPTVANIECIREMQADPNGPKPVFGTLEQFFAHVQRERNDHPVVKGDLQHHAVGCYTAHSDVKKLNRRAENALMAGERFCAMAKLAMGRPYPKAKFAEAWQKVLFNQFHDILAGTSIEAAYDDVRNALGAAIDTADYEANAALSAMAWKIDVQGEGDPFVVFNPHAFPASCPVYISENAASLRRFDGVELPVQDAVDVFRRTDQRPGKVFVDQLVPFGYQVYYASQEPPSVENTLRAEQAAIQSKQYRLEVDPDSGDVTQITHLGFGKTFLKAPAGAVVIEDKSDTWSHGVRAFNEVAGRFAAESIKVVESGPVRATLRVQSRFGDSTLWRDISLYDKLPMIEWRVTVDWREKHRMLKFEFPLDLNDPIATYDAAYAAVTAPTDGAENPGQKWIDVSDMDYGVSLINDCKYGFDVEGSTMRLSALRSPIYAFHDPRQVEEGKQYRYMDQGLHRFTFALVPHEVGWTQMGWESYRLAQMMNMPPVAVEVVQHTGEWDPVGSFLTASQINVDVVAIKEAEDDDSLIVRLLEIEGRDIEDELVQHGEWPKRRPHSEVGRAYPYRLSPFELKTLKIKGDQATEVDLIERE